MKHSIYSKNIIIAFSLGLALSVRAQTQALDNPVLNAAGEEGGVFAACQTIRLKPGFNYRSTGGKTYRLKIDPEVCSTYVTEPVSVGDNHNYVLSVVPLDATDTTEFDSGELSIGRGVRAKTEIRYFDGLGRLSQIVQRGVTPSGSDLAVWQDYDGFGRPSDKWLPVINQGNGAYVSPTIYKVYASAFYNDLKPYSRPEYEPSPLRRVLNQYGAGNAWHAGHPVRTEYMTNDETVSELNCHYFEWVSGNRILKLSNRPSGMYYVKKITDEDGRVSYEFRDQYDRIFLTRQMDNDVRHDTYFVHDDFGNLCFVLSPMASEQYDREGPCPNDYDVIKRYGYYYRYDDYNRCIEKRLPGCDPVYLVHDGADRLRFSQNGEQRLRDEWSFFKYDAFGRSIMEGITIKTGITHEDMLNAFSTSIEEEAAGEGAFNYTHAYSPRYNEPGVTFQRINYYNREHVVTDSCRVLTELDYEAAPDFGVRYQTASGSRSTQGLLTGTLVKMLDSDRLLATAYYYDKKGRVIQQKSTNHLGGVDKEFRQYDFTGNLLAAKHQHLIPGKGAVTECYNYTYDHAGRLLKTLHRIGDQPEVVLASNTYDGLGRIKSKEQGGMPGKINYTYNVRSWLSGIQGNSFRQSLYYNEAGIEGSVPQYGGNISSQQWLSGSEKIQVYKYNYDGLNRLTSGKYGSGKQPVKAPGYDERYNYDKNGNILTLWRYGVDKVKGSSIGSGEIPDLMQGVIADNLTYIYNGNQVKKISDAGATLLYNGANDFNDAVDLEEEYTYDKNGNQTSDLNKKISKIVYNQLNLPDSVYFGDKYISSRYDANGIKRSQSVPVELAVEPLPLVPEHTLLTGASDKGIFPPIKPKPLQTKTDYVGTFVYENGHLKRILTPEGYIQVTDGKYDYHFYQPDYQGNIRTVTNTQGTMIEQNDYYPYGMLFGTSVGEKSKQPYKFGGKEYIASKGFNIYDFGARGVDGADPQWKTMDPLCERYYSVSPYAYCANNPVNAIDPTGELIIFINGMHFGSGGKADYWEGFDRAVAAHLNDYRAIYRDGSVGGAMNVLRNQSSDYRRSMGEKQGKVDGMWVLFQLLNKDGKLKETVKIISHSMGGAYAKGYAKALLEYFTMFNLPPGAIEFEADYAPYQPGEQETVSGVKTYQFSHNNDGVANNFWLGSLFAPLKGAKVENNYSEKKDHGIESFIDEINQLPAGTYKIKDGNIYLVK